MSGLDPFLRQIDRALAGGSVITEADPLDAFAGDESEATPIRPAAAVCVSSSADVAAVLSAASEHGVPVTPRGGGTGRVGSAVPVEGGVVLLFDRLAGLKGIDRREGIAVVEPGLVTGDLHAAVEEEGLFYPPDPNSWESCTVGGNVATNAGGPRAFKYGVTRDHVLGLEVVTAGGEVLRLGRRTRKGVTGYDLTALLVGSEGTLGVVTEVTVKLLPKPETIATLMVLLPDEEAVAGAIEAVGAVRIAPRCAELLDSYTLDLIRPTAKLPIAAQARAMLLLELDGAAAAVERDLEVAGNALAEAGAVDVLAARHSGDRERLWSARRQLSPALRSLARNKLSEDVVVPRTRMAELLGRCRRISEETGIRMPTYGHAGDGNLHVNFLWDDASEQEAVQRGIRRLFEHVVHVGGTLSGEHGIGVLKAPYLPLEQSPALIALQERVKQAFDPKGILNPGKIFPAAAKRFHGAC